MGTAGRGDETAGRPDPGALPDGLGSGASGGGRRARGPAAPGLACPRRARARAVRGAAAATGPRRGATGLSPSAITGPHTAAPGRRRAPWTDAAPGRLAAT